VFLPLHHLCLCVCACACVCVCVCVCVLCDAVGFDTFIGTPIRPSPSHPSPLGPFASFASFTPHSSLSHPSSLVSPHHPPSLVSVCRGRATGGASNARSTRLCARVQGEGIGVAPAVVSWGGAHLLGEEPISLLLGLGRPRRGRREHKNTRIQASVGGGLS
jgi:hypothetical protein